MIIRSPLIAGQIHRYVVVERIAVGREVEQDGTANVQLPTAVSVTTPSTTTGLTSIEPIPAERQTCSPVAASMAYK
jgi:hypothetical protein